MSSVLNFATMLALCFLMIQTCLSLPVVKDQHGAIVEESINMQPPLEDYYKFKQAKLEANFEDIEAALSPKSKANFDRVNGVCKGKPVCDGEVALAKVLIGDGKFKYAHDTGAKLTCNKAVAEAFSKLWPSSIEGFHYEISYQQQKSKIGECCNAPPPGFCFFEEDFAAMQACALAAALECARPFDMNLCTCP